MSLKPSQTNHPSQPMASVALVEYSSSDDEGAREVQPGDKHHDVQVLSRALATALATCLHKVWDVNSILAPSVSLSHTPRVVRCLQAAHTVPLDGIVRAVAGVFPSPFDYSCHDTGTSTDLHLWSGFLGRLSVMAAMPKPQQHCTVMQQQLYALALAADAAVADTEAGFKLLQAIARPRLCLREVPWATTPAAEDESTTQYLWPVLVRLRGYDARMELIASQQLPPTGAAILNLEGCQDTPASRQCHWPVR